MVAAREPDPRRCPSDHPRAVLVASFGSARIDLGGWLDGDRAAFEDALAGDLEELSELGGFRLDPDLLEIEPAFELDAPIVYKATDRILSVEPWRRRTTNPRSANPGLASRMSLLEATRPPLELVLVRRIRRVLTAAPEAERERRARKARGGGIPTRWRTITEWLVVGSEQTRPPIALDLHFCGAPWGDRAELLGSSTTLDEALALFDYLADEHVRAV